MKKLYIYLCGGIGNQMFQFATGFAIAKNNNMKLVLDDWSGFARDRAYKRKFELYKLEFEVQLTKFYERIPVWLYKIFIKFIPKCNCLLYNTVFGRFIRETRETFIPDILFNVPNGNSWLIGYWQSPLYFDRYRDEIARMLMPPEPIDENIRMLGHRISIENSLAISIRLYEESTDPQIHSKFGVVKSSEDIRKVITEAMSISQDLCIYVFCTHMNNFLYQLDLPKSVVFITSDNGYSDPISTLWLLTRCRHHIFNNSSYYWWGAWLSGSIRGAETQMIFASDNFVNSDSIPDYWKTY